MGSSKPESARGNCQGRRQEGGKIRSSNLFRGSIEASGLKKVHLAFLVVAYWGRNLTEGAISQDGGVADGKSGSFFHTEC